MQSTYSTTNEETAKEDQPQMKGYKMKKLPINTFAAAEEEYIKNQLP